MKQILCCKCKERPAVMFIQKLENGKTVSEGYCLKCAMEMNIGPIKQMMQQMGMTEDDVDALTEQFGNMFPANDEDGDFESGGTPTFPSLQGLMKNLGMEKSEEETDELSKFDGSDEPEMSDTAAASKKRKNDKKRRSLNTYCTDLTKKAKEGKLDRIIGRDKEIERAMQILCRRSKNNPCLIGEPGVGKTAVAEGIALRIAEGKAPAKLSEKEVHLLDLTALVAGTQFRGQFESRIKSLIQEVKADGNIILFIDEVHTLVGTGDAEGSMNAAQILKPALSRGEIQVIGATTFNEYRKHIEKDAALERRFQPVKIEEPSIEEASTVLLGIKSYYEDYHKVRISDSLVRKVVVLSERYITDRLLPDKAIDLLDESCTCAALRNKAIGEFDVATKKLRSLKSEEEEVMQKDNIDYEALANIKSDICACEDEIDSLRTAAENNAVKEEDIAKVIELWTGIPAQKVIEDDIKRLGGLEDVLKSKVIGQDEAVSAVAKAIKRSRVQVSARRRPASFIFVGPTGVGKTELVKQLAGEIFDSPETLIRLDMSEFMEKHSVSRIIGSPPGYVGYDEAGQLTEKVRRKPYSIILFDEIEKAHPDVMNILLQILDEGKISDAQGRTVNFENTVIVMTSNAGSEKKNNALGFGKTQAEATKEKVMKALSEFLRPEFIGRVDEVVVFNELTHTDYEKIASLMLEELVSPLSEREIRLTWSDEVCSYLADKSDSGVRGARELRNTIRREIEDKIADIIIEHGSDGLMGITLTLENGAIEIKYI